LQSGGLGVTCALHELAVLAGVQLPPTDYAHLTTALEAAGAAAELVTTPTFIEKAQQLYEMILVRHGLMIVGYSYSAKTSIYK
jgi:dynein heavy chain